MIDWKPISETALLARIHQAEARMDTPQRLLWQSLQIAPERWQQHPYGTAGLGFWVVGVIGRSAIWYNDIEEGFNRSSYRVYGTLEDYWCNQDELEVCVQDLLDVLKRGTDLVRIDAARPARKR